LASATAKIFFAVASSMTCYKERILHRFAILEQDNPQIFPSCDMLPHFLILPWDCIPTFFMILDNGLYPFLFDMSPV
jgi:hypothetical protein